MVCFLVVALHGRHRNGAFALSVMLPQVSDNLSRMLLRKKMRKLQKQIFKTAKTLLRKYFCHAHDDI